MSALTLSAFEELMTQLWENNLSPIKITVANYGFDCIGKKPAKRAPPGTKVRARLELDGKVIQCRPGVVTKTRGHMGAGYVWVQFENVGAWFERDKLSLDI